VIKAVMFDLDDTLYLESDYYRSGFAAAALELHSRGVGSPESLLAALQAIHDSEGKEQVFDKAADRLGFPREWVIDLVTIARTHRPTIRLTEETTRVLRALQAHYALGCVTDGSARNQRRKLSALGVDRFVSAVVVSDDFGRDFWKPHPQPLLFCAQALGVSPRECVYVGDSYERDVRGAHNADMTAVRVCLPGSYSATEVNDGADLPEAEVTSLLDLGQAIAHLCGNGSTP
jgi:putative hydrolase of the HAD superfamily